MDEVRLVKISNYLSRHLRHEPERLGLTLEPGGLVAVSGLLAACAAHNFRVTRAELDEVVAKNSKQRFSFDATGQKIRVNQGHSVEIDLQLEPTVPAELLYHGTGHKTVEAIRCEGLQRMGRHHVHLSQDDATARAVGARHGRAVVFAVAAAAMFEAGYTFYRSANGVWLTEYIPPSFLKEPMPDAGTDSR